MTLGLVIPDVETLHTCEEFLDPCYPMTGPAQKPGNIYQPVAHYTAADDLIDGDPGEHAEDLGGYLNATNRDYWLHRDGSGINSCGRFLPGYAVGYLFAVDWLGGAWELRGFNFKSAANADHNEYTAPILFLVDGADAPTDLAEATARAIWREFRRRSGRQDFRQRPLGHKELCGGCTACPGAGILSELHAGHLDLDYNPTPQPEVPMSSTLATAVRVLDTRVKKQPLQSMIPRRVGILPTPPDWAGAVKINVLATEAAGPGWLSFDGGATTKLNYIGGLTIANEVSIPLKHDASGWFIEVTALTQCHFVADVCGWDTLEP